MQKVQAGHLVEILLQIRVILEVHAIVETSEFENHVNDLVLVLARQAAVALAIEDPLGAFVDHLGSDGIGGVVQFRLEVPGLPRYYQDCLVVLDTL